MTQYERMISKIEGRKTVTFTEQEKEEILREDALLKFIDAAKGRIDCKWKESEPIGAKLKALRALKRPPRFWINRNMAVISELSKANHVVRRAGSESDLHRTSWVDFNQRHSSIAPGTGEF